MKAARITLGEYVRKRIFVGLKTGFNRAYWIDEVTRQKLIDRNPKSAEIIKPLIVGRDVRKWSIQKNSKWIILMKIGTDISRYPEVFSHLQQWEPKLKNRSDQGEQWWELRSCIYYDVFEKPKIVFPDISVEPRFSFDTSGNYADMTAFVIPTHDLYLLGVLNSSSVLSFYSEISSQIRGGYMRYKRQYVEQIPIPNASDADRAAISALVQKCLDAKGVDCQEWEREINERVAALYGL